MFGSGREIIPLQFYYLFWRGRNYPTAKAGPIGLDIILFPERIICRPDVAGDHSEATRGPGTKRLPGASGGTGLRNRRFHNKVLIQRGDKSSFGFKNKHFHDVDVKKIRLDGMVQTPPLPL